MSKPTIVLAPGAWHTPDCFDAVRQQLHARGWETEAIAYPSVGAEPPTKGLPHDAAAVREALERLADKGKEIVLVVHSYGGLVGQNAVEGLGYKQRKAQGKKGGVIMFVYLTAFVAPKGATIKQLLGGQFLPWMKIDGDYCHADTPKEVFYHDVDAEGQKKAIAKLTHSCARIFTDEVLYEPWHDMSCMYFFCETDKALPLFIQQQMAQALGPDNVSYTSVGSHSPFLSQIQEVVDGIEFAAKTGREKEVLN
ncbi:alpha/beta-hydrolase [Delitschia confertaspora ATCC 74209]|uniref:Alpha/beta-hydrolase n=1 Tax=Delitschia confertaspora ATCC 74209 TaxID=1513339 RepID=A0A9P4MN57_9PLEO|nr:alpha/beta-hydrolase [Delitschia confertaspora ATCC 74209]